MSIREDNKRAACIICHKVGRLEHFEWCSLPLHSLDGEDQEEVFYIHRECAGLHRERELLAMAKEMGEVLLAQPRNDVGPVVDMKEARKGRLLNALGETLVSLPDPAQS